MVSPNAKSVWNKRFSEARKQKLNTRVLTAFNTNVDYVKFLDFNKLNTLLKKIPPAEKTRIAEKSNQEIISRVDSEKDFFAALAHCMRRGKALHTTSSLQAFEWFHSFFEKPDKMLVGGQAGIMANQLAALGARVFSYFALFSPHQAELIDEKILVPVARGKKLCFMKPAKAARAGDEVKINWIFEFKKGDTLVLNSEKIVCPRANRLIVASEKREYPIFSSDLEPLLPGLGKRVDVAILAGFHYLHDGKEFDELLKKVVAQLAALKKKNKKLLLHFEYVPIEHKEVEKKVLEAVGKQADSFGLNEVELVEVLRMLECDKEADAIERVENSYSLYTGMKRVFEKLDLKRLQVHCLGYNIILLKKPYDISPQKVRDACVFASFVTSVKALKGAHFVSLKDLESAPELSVSDTGLNQISIFDSEVADELLKTMKKKFSSAERRRFFAEGIIELKNYFVVIVPTPIVSTPRITVGLGDVFTASFLAKEKS